MEKQHWETFKFFIKFEKYRPCIFRYLSGGIYYDEAFLYQIVK